MAGGRVELVMEPTAIGLVSLNSLIQKRINYTAICDARLIYGMGGFHGYLYMLFSFNSMCIELLLDTKQRNWRIITERSRKRCRPVGIHR